MLLKIKDFDGFNSFSALPDSWRTSRWLETLEHKKVGVRDLSGSLAERWVSTKTVGVQQLSGCL